MISRVSALPPLPDFTAEAVKIKNYFRAYPDDSQIFLCGKTGAVIFMISGDVIVSGDAAGDEIKKFLEFIRPESVFSSAENLSLIFGGYEPVNVLICEHPQKAAPGNTFCYDFKSPEAYDLLRSGDFHLPPYEYFAADYCRRKNRRLMRVFGKKDTCIAITLEDEKCRLLSGIVSKQKGLGGALLLSAAAGDVPVLTVCKDEVMPFYEKFGFKPLYKAGYWRK